MSLTTRTAAPTAARPRDARRLALLLVAVACGTNLPVPLLLVYESALRMNQTQVTGLFGAYAAGLIPAVLLAGPAADRWGRRPVVLGAASLAVVASVGFFVGADHIAGLFVARAVQGVAAGGVFTGAAVWIQELADDPSGRVARVTAVAMTGGFSLGCLMGGVLGEWVPFPRQLPYVVHACLAALVLAGAWSARETSQRRTARRTGHIFLPGQRRRALLFVAPPALFVFGLPGTAIGAIPVLVGFHVLPVATTGLVAAMTLAAGSIAAPYQRRLGRWTAATAGACGAAGFLLVGIAADLAGTVPVLLLVGASVFLGAGGGLALSGGLARLPQVAAPEASGRVASGFYVLAYIGFGTPLLLALIGDRWPLPVSFLALALGCAVIAISQAFDRPITPTSATRGGS